jgi:hypothetical protein
MIMNLLKSNNTSDSLPGGNLKGPPSINSPREIIWLILLLLSSLVFSLGFACATPLAAFGALAAVVFSRRDALILCGAVWLVNQVVGYTILNYPCNVDSVSWGLALGSATILATVSSRWIYCHSKTPYLFRLVAAFIAAFGVFEMTLYSASVFVLGGGQEFAVDIVTRILAINSGAFVGLLVLHWLAITGGLISANSEGQTGAGRRVTAGRPAA